MRILPFFTSVFEKIAITIVVIMHGQAVKLCIQVRCQCNFVGLAHSSFDVVAVPPLVSALLLQLAVRIGNCNLQHQPFTSYI